MSNVVGKIISITKKTDFAFEMETISRRGSMLYVIILPNIRQIIALKVTSREHCITRSLAFKYLQSTRRTLDDIISPKLRKEAYVLNILVGDAISKSCYELLSKEHRQKQNIDKNMDMVFSSKRKDDSEIIQSICKWLYLKTQHWKDKIEYKCKRQAVPPYGQTKMTLKRLEKAIDVFWRYKSRVN